MKTAQLLLLLGVAACAAPPADDASTSPADQEQLHDWLLGDEVPISSRIMALPDAALLADSKLQDEPRFQVGVAVSVQVAVDLRGLDPDPGAAPLDVSGGALRFETDGFVWSAAVHAPGAASLRLGIEDLSLPDGMELWVYTQRGQVDGPFTGHGRGASRAFYTQTLASDTLYLQLRYEGSDSEGALDAVNFTLTEAAYLDERFLRGLAPIFETEDEYRAHCSNLNETCVENAECDLQPTGTDGVVQSLRDASAHMLFQSGSGWYICSGALIESLDGTEGHFLTANHCISTAAEAASLETYFHFTTPCPPGGGPTSTCDYADGNNANTPATFGATIVDSSATTDFTLMKLDGAPPAGTVHLPFSTAPVANSDGADLYRISYPSGAPQAFSHHQVDAGYSLCGTPGDFIYSTDLLGATEGGSSGSAVVNGAGEIVGQLYGACGNNTNNECDTVNNRTYDGAFASTWQNSALVRNALAQEPLPQVIVLATHAIPSVSRRKTWTTSFVHDGSYDTLTFDLVGPNGDGDLYVKFGSPPTTSDYDCRPYLPGTVESCTADPAQTGTYYVMVRAYQAFSGATLTVSTLQTGCADSDGDGVCNADDACPGYDDGIDADGDGAPDGCDNCPSVSNASQADTDADGVGDACDVCPLDDPDDSDADGVCDSDDPCPYDNPDDSDGDGVCDSSDLCSGFDDAADADGDGVPDGCDTCPNGVDSDGDGVCDADDPCPNDNPDDSDGDGVCDSADTCPGGDDGVDTDADGVPDFCDVCPVDAADDSDGDGVCDSDDVCLGGDDTADADSDGVPDFCDACPVDAADDSDGDGVCDSDDVCPGGDDNIDADGDGVPDDCDACPSEAGTGSDGCGACDYADTISSGSQYHAIGSQTQGTTLAGSLEWTPTSANLDLELQVNRSGRWRRVAKSATSGFESISYTVPGAYDGYSFRWKVKRRSGTADYCLTEG